MKKTYYLFLILVFLTVLMGFSFCQQVVSSKEEKKETNNQIDSIYTDTVATTESELPKGIQQLLAAYPDFLIGADENTLIWHDSSRMQYDDAILKTGFDMLLNTADLEDQMSIPYPGGSEYDTPEVNEDPGRIRHEPFFKKMYGNSANEVRENLTTIYWLPSSVNKALRVTTINGVAGKLQAISNELDTLEHLHKYLNNPAGTFYWRTISGTQRLSMHSFGIAIDINVNYSNYWKWDSPTGENLTYKNKIPMEIVLIFEKHGFIWGGKWFHYDTMHFEYRPEYFVKI